MQVVHVCHVHVHIVITHTSLKVDNKTLMLLTCGKLII